MGRVRVQVDIDASPAAVWEEVRHLDRHVNWMADAVAIRFTSRSRQGRGTTFECDTKLGPFRLTDEMEITEWRTRSRMGVRHTGMVTGTGRFTLTARKNGRRTRFRWQERLAYPWWMGGPLAGVVGDRVLARVWKANLRRLKATVEGQR